MTKPKVKDFEYVSGKKYDGMLGRCYRKKDPSYANYGGRGIAVAEAWIKDIETFRAWLRAHLSDIGLSTDTFVSQSSKWQLDRIDPNGHYTANNCRICNGQENARNKRKKRREVISAEGTVCTI